MSTTMPSPQAGNVPQWSIADRLRKARETAGMEQTELASITGVSRATISAAENGHRAPSRATVRLWAMATGVPLGWIEQGDAWCTPWDLNPEPTDYESGAPLAAVIVGPWGSSVAEYDGVA